MDFATYRILNMKVLIVLLLVAAVVESITVLSLEDCSRPAITGPCRGNFRRYSYDPSTQGCRNFTYGGCRGNKNNFRTEKECYEKCGGSLIPQECREPPETGLCIGYFPRYHYDPSTDECKPFIYGGCGGNKNNFLTKEECHEKCGVKCAENAHFKSCGTACPKTCDNYDKPPSACTLKCVSGCQCDEGFVQAEGGSCVTPEECPIKKNCRENEHYSNCGTMCPKTCGNFANDTRVCAAVCVKGCQCDKGFVRTESGNCVKPKECPVTGNVSLTRQECRELPETGLCRGYFPRYYYDPSTNECKPFIYGGCGGNKNNFLTKEECHEKCGAKCAENAHFKSCGTACPKTCDNYDKPPSACPLICISGCQCDEGFVQAEGGSCVKPEECPVKKHRTDCPKNKEYGSFGDCPDSCYSLDHPVTVCTLRLNWGCKCKPGYVLKEDKVFDSDCIKPEECPLDK